MASACRASSWAASQCRLHRNAGRSRSSRVATIGVLDLERGLHRSKWRNKFPSASILAICNSFARRIALRLVTGAFLRVDAPCRVDAERPRLPATVREDHPLALALCHDRLPQNPKTHGRRELAEDIGDLLLSPLPSLVRHDDLALTTVQIALRSKQLRVVVVIVTAHAAPLLIA